MNPKRIREALRWQDDIEALIYDQHEQHRHLVEPVQEAFDAAEWAVDLFEECDNCKGRGRVEPFRVTGFTSDPCPACGGRGYVLNREQLRDAATVASAMWSFNDREVVVANAILAFLFGSIDFGETRQEVQGD